MEGYGGIVQWLLEEDTPHVRYNTLRHILRHPPEDWMTLERRHSRLEALKGL